MADVLINTNDFPLTASGLTGGALLGGNNALKPTGVIAETFPRSTGGQINAAALSTGRVTLAGVWLHGGQVVTSIAFYSMTTALGTGTIQWYALYNSALAKLAQTADTTSTAWAANTKISKALTAPFTTTYTGLHYLAIMVTATTVPTLVGTALSSATGPSAELPVLDIIGDSACTATAPVLVTAASTPLLRPYATCA